MTPERFEKLRYFLSLHPDSSQWEMTPNERLTLLGLLELLRPASSLELGHRYGGCTAWLSAYCHSVVSVDIDPSVVESCKRFPNVTPLHMSSADALAWLAGHKRTFDFALVDADHSPEAAYSDLEATLPLARVIVMHDVGNPATRQGYLKALEGTGYFHDLDLVDGHLQVDGPWGGLGLVLKDVPASAPCSVTRRLTSNFALQHRALLELASSGVPRRSFLKRVVERFFR